MSQFDPAAAISGAGVQGKCPLCEQAVDLFVSIYGAEAAILLSKSCYWRNLSRRRHCPETAAETCGAAVHASVRQQGRMQSLLESIPVRVITNESIALLGAARCAVVNTEPSVPAGKELVYVMLSEADIRILNAPQELFQAAAAEFIALASTAIRDHEKFSVALSGVPRQSLCTPFGESHTLLGEDLFFWSDERHVPPAIPRATIAWQRSAALDSARPPENIFRVRAEGKKMQTSWPGL